MLPPDHTRADYDFETKAGDMRPIRIPPVDTGFNIIPAHVWCIRHGWEVEIVEVLRVAA